MSQRGEPRLHPISALPLIATAIEGMLEGTLRSSTASCSKPAGDRTSSTTRRWPGSAGCSANRLSTSTCYVEQLRRWGAGSLSDDQRREVERLRRCTATLRDLNTSILTLAEELGRGTIESVLAKSDAEIGLEELLRRGRSAGA